MKFRGGCVAPLACLLLAGPANADPDCKSQVAKGVMIKGSFAHDRGCMRNKIYVAGKAYDDATKAAPVALKRLGWRDPKKRAELAVMWTRKVLTRMNGFSISGSGSKPGFKKLHYPLRAQVTKDGGVLVRFWRQGRLRGMIRPKFRFYHETSVTFSPKGEMRSISTLSTHKEKY
jgi:hypothetical protein